MQPLILEAPNFDIEIKLFASYYFSYFVNN